MSSTASIILSPPQSPTLAAEIEEPIQIFVKNVTGETTVLSVPLSTSIATVKSLAVLRSPTPTPSSETRLVFAGRHLSSPNSTLADYHIPASATLHLALPLKGGMPPKKLRCSFKDCKERVAPVVGECGFCNGQFCGKHRLLESHACEGLEDCKKESKERNAEKLNTERTQMVRGV